MIVGLAAAVPDSLAGYASRMVVTPASELVPPPGCVPASEIARDGAVFAALAEPFVRRYSSVDERAVLSFWTQHYFAALIVPALAAAARLGRVLPLGLDAVGCEPGADGTIARFHLVSDGTGGDGSRAVDALLGVLVAGHLRPFVAGCAGWSGLSPRVLWCNAGVMLDWAAGELGLVLPPRETPAAAEAALLVPFRGGGSCARKRRTCCLRLRLAGVPRCGASCPLNP